MSAAPDLHALPADAGPFADGYQQGYEDGAREVAKQANQHIARMQRQMTHLRAQSQRWATAVRDAGVERRLTDAVSRAATPPPPAPAPPTVRQDSMNIAVVVVGVTIALLLVTIARKG